MAQSDYILLAVDPGNTTTKIGIFRNDKSVHTTSVSHDDSVLGKFKCVYDQKSYRAGLILKELASAGFKTGDLSCCVGRGGILKPLKSGTYRVNKKMLGELAEAARGEHASNLGAAIADEIASMAGLPAFIVDPVCVDEMADIARISGWSEINRESISHALNMKAVAKRHAKNMGKSYSELRLVIAHLGSGISMSAHENGMMIDVINPRDEGPFSPERAGGMPSLLLAKKCFSGKYNYKSLEKILFGGGGLYSYLGTRDLKKVEEMIAGGDKKACLIYDAMVYQIAKFIGEMCTVLCGKLDTILLTGGMAHDTRLCEEIKKRAGFLGKITIYPGEDELQALAEGALRVLRGEETALEYT